MIQFIRSTSLIFFLMFSLYLFPFLLFIFLSLFFFFHSSIFCFFLFSFLSYLRTFEIYSKESNSFNQLNHILISFFLSFWKPLIYFFFLSFSSSTFFALSFSFHISDSAMNIYIASLFWSDSSTTFSSIHTSNMEQVP